MEQISFLLQQISATYPTPVAKKGPMVNKLVVNTWLWVGYRSAFVTEVLMFTIPETLPSQVLLNKAKRIRRLKMPGDENVKAPVEDSDRSLTGIFKVALTRPWKILLDPISFLVAIYLSVVYTLLYMLFTIYPIVFQQKRGWNSGVGELPLIGTIFGAAIGAAIVFTSSLNVRKKAERGHIRRPEDRLHLAIAGGILFPVTMFW